MNIFGIGTDIVNIKRIQNSLKKTKILKKEYLLNLKPKYAKIELIKLIVLPKDLQPKKLYLKHWVFIIN